MLPDLPAIKDELLLLQLRYLRHQVHRRMPGINEAPQHTVHEGERTRIVRADASVEESEMKTAAAEMSIGETEASAMTTQERKAILDSIADDMARQISEHAFASINDTLEKAGQVVDNGGRKLDAEAMLVMLEKMQFDFDDNGQLKNLSIVVGPEMRERANAEFARLFTDPVLSVRYAALMQSKWADYRDREASRKLVG
jgi:hypothetical protein